MEYKIEDTVKGTTLKIIDENHSDYKCICLKCGNTDIYDKKYLAENGQECRYCRLLNTYYNNTEISQTAQIKELIKQERKLKNNEIKKPRAGTKYFNTSKKYDKLGNIGYNLVIIGDYGEFSRTGYNRPTHMVIRCNKCGAYFLKPIIRQTGLKYSFRCGTCRKLDEYFDEKDKREKEFGTQKVTATKVVSKPDEKIQNPVIEDKPKIRQKPVLTVDSKEVKEFIQECKNNNPSQYIKVDIVDGKKLVTYTCKKCGYTIERERHNKNYMVLECPGCKAMIKDNNYRGICQLNYIGHVYNGMEIISQYIDDDKGYLCNIRCNGCRSDDSVINGVYLIDVLNRKYYHNCKYSNLCYICPFCGKLNENIKMTDVANDKHIECEYCKKELDNSDLNAEIAANDMKSNFYNAKKAIRDTESMPKFKSSPNNTLMYDPIPIYRGEDDDFYRCICMKHGSRMMLTMNEIVNYNCEKCNDINETIFKTLDPSKIVI